MKRLNKKKQIITIEPITTKSYKSCNNELSFYDLQKSSLKDEFYSSYLYTKDSISGIVSINKGVEDSDLQDAIELEAYETLNLDMATKYKIISIEAITQESSERVFNVFAFDTNTINKKFQAIISKIKYIDYITMVPFLIGALYKKNILESKNVECFIYFQKEDSFLAIYKNGKYLYSKSLNYSLHQINEKFCKLLGKKIPESDFIDFLLKEGLNTQEKSHQKHLQQLFREIFLYINDIIVFFKRSYNEKNIDRVYIGSEFGDIQGLKEYSKSYFGLKVFDFDFARSNKECQIEQMHTLLWLNSQLYMEEPDDFLNLTLYKRPPLFSQRVSGKLIYAVILGLFVSLAYPAYNFIYGYALNIQTNKKQQEYNTLHVKAQALRDTIAKLQDEKNKLNQKILKENKKLNSKKMLLDEIYAKKVKYPMKAVILQDLANLINKKRIKIAKIVADNKEVIASLVSQSDKQITEFLKDISKMKKYHISTKQIVQKDKKTYYTSNIRVEIR